MASSPASSSSESQADASLASDTAHVLRLFQQGLTWHQQGQLTQALAAYKQVLALQPAHFDVLYLSGLIHIQTQEYVAALTLMLRAVVVRPNEAGPHFQMGKLLNVLERPKDALRCFNQSLALMPDDAKTHAERGNALGALGRLEEALADYDHALTIRPNYPQTAYNRANVLLRLNRLEEALAGYDQALALKPDFPQAHGNRSVALQNLGRLDEALASVDRAIALAEIPDAHYNRGNMLRDLQRFEEALVSFDRAIALKPDYAHAWNNRGNALKELGRVDEALASYDRSLAFEPHNESALWNKSLLLLLKGDYKNGWPLYEWGWGHQRGMRREFTQPLWRGRESIAGKTILLHVEQGLGDGIQFCRYAQQVHVLGARVILETPTPLLTLFKGLAGVDVLIEKGQMLPAFDCHSPLMSLPEAFDTQLHNVPSSQAYLRSQPERVAVWRDRLGPKTRLRVGLIWRGNPQHLNDANRSVPLTELMRHLPPDCDYISLQKDLHAADQPVLTAARIKHYGDVLHDFSDTAALCDLMDLVISVDTSVAHLAGALGKTTWVLLPFMPDWRWLLDRDDTPWYASVRLYRQDKTRRWEPVLRRVANDLARML